MIPPIGTTTVMLTFTATSKERIKNVVNQIKDDCIELYSYELKNHRTSQGEIFEANIEMKVRRGNHNERLIDYMDESTLKSRLLDHYLLILGAPRKKSCKTGGAEKNGCKSCRRLTYTRYWRRERLSNLCFQEIS